MSETPPLNLVWPRLLELLDCLCTRINDSALDPVCVCEAMPGMNVALDYALGGCSAGGADGMAWVRLTSIYMTSNFPAQLQGTVRCDNAEVAFAFEMGIIRSMPLGDDEGNPPPLEMMLAATERQVSEAMLIANAILCCYDTDVAMGTYTPIGPEGGAVGGRWTASSLVGA